MSISQYKKFYNDWLVVVDQRLKNIIPISILTVLVIFCGSTFFYMLLVNHITVEILYALSIPAVALLIWYVLYRMNIANILSMIYVVYQSMFVSHAIICSFSTDLDILYQIMINVPIIIVPALFVNWHMRHTIINIVIGLIFFFTWICLANPSLTAVYLGYGPILLPIAVGTVVYSNFKFEFGYRIFSANKKLENVNSTINRRNKQLAKQTMLAEKSIKTNNEIMSVVSHDIRGALSGVIMVLDLFSKKMLDTEEEKERVLEMAKGSAQKTNKLLEDLLIWAKSHSNSLNIQTEELNLKNELNNVLSLFEEVAEKKKVELNLHIPLDLEILTDLPAFQLIFRNLLSNALKFSNEESSITLSAYKDDFHKVRIDVADKGIGMTTEVMEGVFSASNTTHGTNNEIGNGLGLILVKEVVALNSGSISVQSTPNQGTTFSVFLPENVLEYAT